MSRRYGIGWAILSAGIFVKRFRSYDTAVTVASDAAIEPTRARLAQPIPYEDVRQDEVVGGRVAKGFGERTKSAPVVRQQVQWRKPALDVDHASIQMSISADAEIETTRARQPKAIPDEAARPEGPMRSTRVVQPRVRERKPALERQSQVDDANIQMTSSAAAIIETSRAGQPEANLDEDLKHNDATGSRDTKGKASTRIVRPRAQWRKPTFEHEVGYANNASTRSIHRVGAVQTAYQEPTIHQETTERVSSSQTEIREPAIRPSLFAETTNSDYGRSRFSPRLGAALSWIRSGAAQVVDFFAIAVGPDAGTTLGCATMGLIVFGGAAAVKFLYFE